MVKRSKKARTRRDEHLDAKPDSLVEQDDVDDPPKISVPVAMWVSGRQVCHSSA